MHNLNNARFGFKGRLHGRSRKTWICLANNTGCMRYAHNPRSHRLNKSTHCHQHDSRIITNADDNQPCSAKTERAGLSSLILPIFCSGTGSERGTFMSPLVLAMAHRNTSWLESLARFTGQAMIGSCLAFCHNINRMPQLVSWQTKSSRTLDLTGAAKCCCSPSRSLSRNQPAKSFATKSRMRTRQTWLPVVIHTTKLLARRDHDAWVLQIMYHFQGRNSVSLSFHQPLLAA